MRTTRSRVLLARSRVRAYVPALCFALATGCWPISCWSVHSVDREVISPWLLCADCTQGELDRIVQTGPRLIPYLVTALQDGPTQTADSLARRRAIESGIRAANYRAKRSLPLIPPGDSSELVENQMEGFNLTYRLRAAQALFRLNPARASTEVAQFCTNHPQELTKHSEFKPSFASIGACP